MKDGPARLVKYGAAAVVLGLYAAVSAWLVAGEGESYRKGLAARPTFGPKITVEPAPEPPPPPARVPERGPEPTPAPTPTPTPPPPVVGSTPKPPAEPAKEAARPRALDAFWSEPDQAKVWDYTRITVDDERELGRALHRMVLHDHAEVDGGPLQRRLEEAAKPYLAARTRKDVEYTFTVLDCPRLNVFSHPGGYIYVCKGLFDWIAEDEDYALGFILAHEIAHVDLAHAITCLKDPDVKKFKFGAGLLFYAVTIPGGYLKQQEQEADDWAIKRMLKDGRTRYETLAFLRRLEDYAKSHGFENRPKLPNDTPEVPLLDNHIRTHPIPRTRLEQAKALIDRLLKI